jgi:hypothetical protein
MSALLEDKVAPLYSQITAQLKPDHWDFQNLMSVFRNQQVRDNCTRESILPRSGKPRRNLRRHVCSVLDCLSTSPAKRPDHFGSLFSSLALKVDSACSFRNVYGPSVRDPRADRVAFFARSLEIELRS